MVGGQEKGARSRSPVTPFFHAKRILVTGAGGSVGLAVAERLAETGCAALAVLDHHDHSLLEVAERAKRMAPNLEVIAALCNIRDADAVQAWLARIRPDIVIHAAALKHVHVGESHPSECVLTNLIGLKNVLSAAAAANAACFLQVSTDKAASPVCVMGASKRLAELYLTGFRREHPGSPELKAVRFGNIMGSQGSVAPRFAAQIAAGGPLELTHPEMQRYFMTVEEAVEFILGVVALDDDQASGCGVYYRDMGEPTRITDLANALMKRAGREVDIRITGIRPGEKLKEELFDDYERADECGLAGVYRVTACGPDAYVTSSDLAQLEACARSAEDEVVKRKVFTLLDARLGRAERSAG